MKRWVRAEQISRASTKAATSPSSIGAVDWDSYPADPDFIVLADTEGNRFCIVDLAHVPDQHS